MHPYSTPKCTWPSCKRVLRRTVIARAKLDDMPALKTMFSIQLSKIARWVAAGCNVNVVSYVMNTIHKGGHALRQSLS